jgi:hypothetical protein
LVQAARGKPAVVQWATQAAQVQLALQTLEDRVLLLCSVLMVAAVAATLQVVAVVAVAVAH